MCGIAGILKFNPHALAEPARLRRMGDVLAHRGPDGEGVYVDGQAGLAHRRLAIIDPAAGHQPMSNEDGTVWIAFNGEIYNHAALRPGLQERGHVYQTRCDTETIIHLYEDVGERAPELLQGMFAFAVWDGPRRRLLLGRDRLGIKPLYVACSDDELLFASEIKAILAALPSAPSLDDSQLPAYLSAGFVTGEDTLFKGIKRLLPGHTLSWSADDGFRRRRYWQLPAPSTVSALSFADEAAALRGRLTAAVERHLMSDVPLGVFLSGGLDSSALAAIVSKMAPPPLRTFSVGFSDREANELGYARQVADWIGSEHHEVVVSPEQFFGALPRLVWHEDEPIAFPSSVPLNFLSRLAREHVKVVLTGEGADELFLGYNRYRVTHWNNRLGRPYWAVTSSAFRGHVQQVVRHLPASLRRVFTRTFLALDPGLRSIYLENFAVLSEARQRQLLKRPELLDDDVHGRAVAGLDGGEGDLLDRMSRLDMQSYLHELLMKQDQMSMAASIESRVPFLDDQLVDHVAALPSAFKLRGWQTKAVLREAVREILPPAILSRKKMGFPVPVGRWLRGGFRPLVDEFVLGPRAEARQLFDATALRRLAAEHAAGAQHGDRLWLLVNLEIWQRIFHDGESPEHVMRAAGTLDSKAA
jgi:asparagine synthase (glutamine-hydrolysing)